jgi:hypothetical protein
MNKTDITFINPPETTVDIDGVSFTVQPIKMRVLPALVKCVEPVFEDFAVLVVEPRLEDAVKMLGRNSALVCQAIAICTGTEAGAIEDMTPDRAAALLLVCCEVNADFFVRAVPSITAQAETFAPLLHRKTAALLARVPKAMADGALPSSSSPELGIATPTS